MLYIDNHIDTFNLDEAIARLPLWRRRQAESIKRADRRRESVAAYRLLCDVLEDGYGITEPPTFGYAEGGKPFLVEHPDIHFNLSHCRLGVACALGTAPVGADIEWVRPYKDDLARYVLNDREYAIVNDSPCPDEMFMRYWTMKESLVKLLGLGLRTDLKPLLERDDVSFQIHDVDEPYHPSGQRRHVVACLCRYRD